MRELILELKSNDIKSPLLRISAEEKVKVQFRLNEEWSGYDIYLAVWSDLDSTRRIQLNKRELSCEVPAELLKREGLYIFVQLQGILIASDGRIMNTKKSKPSGVIEII